MKLRQKQSQDKKNAPALNDQVKNRSEDMVTYNTNNINKFWDEFKMDAKDCKPSYPCTYEESRKRLNDVLFDLVSKYAEFGREGRHEYVSCNVKDFKLSEQFELLACLLEHHDYNDNTTYHFQERFGDLLRNVTGNNILEFGKNLIFTALHDSLSALQDEIDHYISDNFSTIKDSQHSQDYDDRYAYDNLEDAI